jgi:hypothetical protein
MNNHSHTRSAPRGLALRAAFVATLVITLPGCYRYVPTELEATPPGTAARIVVTRAGSEQLREAMPTAVDGAPVRGTFVEVDGNDAIFTVPVARRQEGMAQRSIEQRVQVPLGEIVSFERRELNKTTTAILVAGMAGFATAIVVAIAEARKGENPDGPGPPDESVIEIPLFSVLWGR